MGYRGFCYYFCYHFSEPPRSIGNPGWEGLGRLRLVKWSNGQKSINRIANTMPCVTWRLIVWYDTKFKSKSKPRQIFSRSTYSPFPPLLSFFSVSPCSFISHPIPLYPIPSHPIPSHSSHSSLSSPPLPLIKSSPLSLSRKNLINHLFIFDSSQTFFAFSLVFSYFFTLIFRMHVCCYGWECFSLFRFLFEKGGKREGSRREEFRLRIWMRLRLMRYYNSDEEMGFVGGRGG